MGVGISAHWTIRRMNSVSWPQMEHCEDSVCSTCLHLSLSGKCGRFLPAVKGWRNPGHVTLKKRVSEGMLSWRNITLKEGCTQGCTDSYQEGVGYLGNPVLRNMSLILKFTLNRTEDMCYCESVDMRFVFLWICFSASSRRNKRLKVKEKQLRRIRNFLSSSPQISNQILFPPFSFNHFPSALCVLLAQSWLAIWLLKLQNKKQKAEKKLKKINK